MHLKACATSTPLVGLFGARFFWLCAAPPWWLRLRLVPFARCVPCSSVCVAPRAHGVRRCVLH